jgi:outer membrane lipoprotein SlyB
MELAGKLIPLAAAVLLSGPLAYAQQPLIYPSKGQTPEQQNKDQGECYSWAKQQTGVDPVALAQQSANQPAPTGPQGQRLKGAAGGAVVGTAVGAIAGDAGKGAAIGAVTGTVAGGARQRRQAKGQQQNQQQAQQQTQQALANYNKAFSACMEGHGYVVK